MCFFFLVTCNKQQLVSGRRRRHRHRHRHVAFPMTSPARWRLTSSEPASATRLLTEETTLSRCSTIGADCGVMVPSDVCRGARAWCSNLCFVPSQSRAVLPQASRARPKPGLLSFLMQTAKHHRTTQPSTTPSIASPSPSPSHPPTRFPRAPC